MAALELVGRAQVAKKVRELMDGGEAERRMPRTTERKHYGHRGQEAGEGPDR
jgi:hypothetical protein